MSKESKHKILQGNCRDLKVSEDTLERPQSRSTVLPRYQKKERWGTNNDKRNAIYEPTDAQTKTNCNRGTALERLQTVIVRCQPSETDWGGSRHVLWGPTHRLAIITKTRLFKYLKILPPKNENFQIKKLWYFSYFCSKHRLWVLVRTASARWF